MTTSKTVLSIHAHPDDAEFTCAGTMALLHKKGWEVHIATIANGDCGSVELDAKTISKIRYKEAEKSAEILGGSYHCLESRDIFIQYDEPTLLKAAKLIRQIKPTIVFAPSPCDYMLDHEITSKIVQTACFICGIPNIKTPGAEPFENVPWLYYVDAIEGKDIFGNKIEPCVFVDISTEIGVKEEMLCCHESQRNWLMAHHGMDEYIISMKTWSKKRGQDIGVGFAEGFRQ
ncbi:MAG: PIG-L family deacetylase, partial [Planctomycetes bacterium]|nr:PIG-L family deacetylase [Planctomycetota bacterium]